jgi:fumarate reductase subunit C
MPRYVTYQPKLLQPHMSPYWYFDRWPYLKFMLRESSCIFVAYFAVVMLVQIRAIEHGPSAYAHFQNLMCHPIFLILNAISLIMISFHAVTWFMLVPRVFMRQLLGFSVPDQLTAAPNYGIWLVASLVIALFALRLI